MLGTGGWVQMLVFHEKHCSTPLATLFAQLGSHHPPVVAPGTMPQDLATLNIIKNLHLQDARNVRTIAMLPHIVWKSFIKGVYQVTIVLGK